MRRGRMMCAENFYTMERVMNRTCLFLIAVSITTLISGCGHPKGHSATERREYVQNMKQTTLDDFYARKPELKQKVESSAGYGVFSTVGFTAFFVGGGDGYGVVVDKANNKETYMRMLRGSAGIGLGVKDFRVLVIFHSQDVMDTFVNKGWQFSGEGEASAKASERGGAAETSGNMAKNVELYELTSSGLSASATVGGTKFWRDKELN
jgi:lipid-binding SYLF domain-containing protein